MAVVPFHVSEDCTGNMMLLNATHEPVVTVSLRLGNWTVLHGASSFVTLLLPVLCSNRRLDRGGCTERNCIN